MSDSGVIAVADGEALGVAIAVLMLTACLLPFGIVAAWSYFRSFFQGESEDE